MANNRLPEFERPPLDEVAMGLQFEPFEKMRVAHFGLYWAQIRSAYPHTEDQAPIAHAIELLDLAPVQQQINVVVGPAPLARCWFLDETRCQLIQVQKDRFLRNWRQISGTETYPRYDRLAGRFKEEWNRFVQFAREENLGVPKVNQCELTYVNHFEPGLGWKDLSESNKLFSFIRESKQGGFLPPPDTLGFETQHKLPDDRGRLRLQAQPVFRGRDLKLVLSFTLVARGNPGGGTDEQIFGWFDLAHEWIVRAFDALTTPRMHQLWMKKHD